MNKEKCLDIVIEEIENMLYNNKQEKESSLAENFENWCEGGVVFYMRTEKDVNKEQRITEQEEKFCIELMKRISPYIDKMTEELYKIYQEIEEKEI